MNELQKYFTNLQEAILKGDGIELPMYHSCTFAETLNYLRNNKIAVSECDVFNKERFIYIFLGKARYIREIPNKSLDYVPFCFVFKPSAGLDIFRVYPFDTGAVVLNRYQPIISKDEIEEVKVKFLLGESLTPAYNLIDFFYTNHSEYINENVIQYPDQKIKNICIQKGVLELQKLNALYQSIHGNMDGRRNTIEVHVRSEIELDANFISHILMPTDDYTKNSDIDFYLAKNPTIVPLFYAESMPHYYDQYYSLLLIKSILLANNNAN